MKNLFLKLIVVGSLLNLCCHPASSEMPLEKPDFYWGYIQANKNDVVWKVDPFANKNLKVDSFFFITGHLLGKYHNIVESFTMHLPFRIGKHQIHSFFTPDNDYKAKSAFFLYRRRPYLCVL